MRRCQTDGWFRAEGSGSTNSKSTIAPCGVSSGSMNSKSTFAPCGARNESVEIVILHHQIFQFGCIKHDLQISKDKSGSGIERCRKAVGNGFAQVQERRRRSRRRISL